MRDENNMGPRIRRKGGGCTGGKKEKKRDPVRRVAATWKWVPTFVIGPRDREIACPPPPWQGRRGRRKGSRWVPGFRAGLDCFAIANWEKKWSKRQAASPKGTICGKPKKIENNWRVNYRDILCKCFANLSLSLSPPSPSLSLSLFYANIAQRSILFCYVQTGFEILIITIIVTPREVMKVENTAIFINNVSLKYRITSSIKSQYTIHKHH